MFNFENIDLTTCADCYPSSSEKGRFRTDYNSTLKYDLPIDFHIKSGFFLNYDNQSAISGNDLDNVFSSGFGWKID